MFQNVPECSRMFQNVPKCSRMFQDVQGCSRMFKDVQRCLSVCPPSWKSYVTITRTAKPAPSSMADCLKPKSCQFWGKSLEGEVFQMSSTWRNESLISIIIIPILNLLHILFPILNLQLNPKSLSYNCIYYVTNIHCLLYSRASELNVSFFLIKTSWRNKDLPNLT